MSQTQISGNLIKDGGLTDADIASANKDGTAGTVSMRSLGSGATQCCAGNDSRLSDARTPVGTTLTSALIWVGSAGNIAVAVSLTGDITITNTGVTAITALAVTDAKVATANKDGTAGTASMRTLGTGATQAAPGNIISTANTWSALQVFSAGIESISAGAVTHLKLKYDGSNYATMTVQSSGGLIFQSVGSAAGFQFNNGISLNSNLISDVATPVAGTDAANKNYVDAVVNGLDWKQSVRVATTANGTLATAYENGDTIDGIALVTGNRILIKNQTSGSENGIYTVNASGAPTRTLDADASSEVTANMAVFVSEGTVNADTQWQLTTNDPITLNTTALVFAQIGGAGTYIGSSSILLTGNAFSVIFGITSVTACAGNDSRLSDARTPVGTALTSALIWVGSAGNVAAAVALSGDVTITNAGVATIAALAVTDSKVAAANKDGAAATPSMRTLGTGAAQACGGTDARLSDARSPSGSAAGELAGTYPNPTLALAIRPSFDLRYTFSSTTTNADPGSGLIRLNNATLASVTSAYVNPVDVAGITISTIIDSWTATGTLAGDFVGIITFYNRSNPSNFAKYYLVGTVSAGGYYTFTLTYIASHGTIGTTAGDLGIEFIPIPRHALKTNFRAHKNGTDQTGVASNTATKVTFTTEVFDTGSFYDSTNSKWTPPSGPVLITVQLCYASGSVAANAVEVLIYKNGSILLNGTGASQPVQTAFEFVNITQVDVANGTDYYEIYALNIAAGTKVISGSTDYTWFSGICF